MTYTEYVEMTKTPKGRKELFSINCENITNLYRENKIDSIEASCRIYNTGLVLGIYEFPTDSEMLKIMKNHKKAKRR